MRPLLSILVALTVGGCYRYRPIDSPAGAIGHEVSIDLSDRGTVSVNEALGSGVATVEGTIRAADSAAVTVSLSKVFRRGDREPTDYAGETVTLLPGDIRGVSVRELSRSRTMLFAGGTAALAAAAAAAIVNANGQAQGDGTTKPPPTTSRSP
jgi:hypothetical protein